MVDDKPEVLYNVKAGLNSLHVPFDILAANSGRECISLLKTNAPDLIILDIAMKEMDGWDTVAKIKSIKKFQDIPIIFLTSRTDPISRSMGSLASADYITQPINMKELKRRIEAVLHAATNR